MARVKAGCKRAHIWHLFVTERNTTLFALSMLPWASILLFVWVIFCPFWYFIFPLADVTEARTELISFRVFFFPRCSIKWHQCDRERGKKGKRKLHLKFTLSLVTPFCRSSVSVILLPSVFGFHFYISRCEGSFLTTAFTWQFTTPSDNKRIHVSNGLHFGPLLFASRVKLVNVVNYDWCIYIVSSSSIYNSRL